MDTLTHVDLTSGMSHEIPFAAMEDAARILRPYAKQGEHDITGDSDPEDFTIETYAHKRIGCWFALTRNDSALSYCVVADKPGHEVGMLTFLRDVLAKMLGEDAADKVVKAQRSLPAPWLITVSKNISEEERDELTQFIQAYAWAMIVSQQISRLIESN